MKDPRKDHYICNRGGWYCIAELEGTGAREVCDCDLPEECECEEGDDGGRDSFGGGDAGRYQDSDVVVGVLT